jgi:hypothetical protein
MNDTNEWIGAFRHTILEQLQDVELNQLNDIEYSLKIQDYLTNLSEQSDYKELKTFSANLNDLKSKKRKKKKKIFLQFLILQTKNTFFIFKNHIIR